jgi:phospholipid/cholesterol/gamma-HCH transport system substrate-binding protein
MAKTTGWRDLKIGLICSAAVVAGVVSVLLFARVGALDGDSFTLYAATNEATGILPGSEVWLAGQKVGLVKRVGFRPVSVDTSNRLLLELEVLSSVQPLLRRDAVAQIRAGTSLIGAPVVYVSPGAPNAPMIASGDTILSRPQDDTQGVTAQLALAGEDFPIIIDNMKVLNAQLHAARGTLGAIGISGGAQVEATTGAATRLVDRALTGPGTVGLALRGRALTSRAQTALARADSVRLLVTAPAARTSLGRFRRDSSLLRMVDSVRAEVGVVRQLLAEPRGTAGRVLLDSALVRELARTGRELDALAADVKRNPLRYISF